MYRDFYDTDITWSRSSNIDLVIDNVYPNRDMAYTNDGLERLAQATQGTWDAPTSSMTTTVQDELWTLSQTGNWQNHKLDLDGNGSYAGTDELDDTETFNAANELTARDTDSNSTNDYTLAYDAAGNMTDDGKDYKYVYDAFGRLVQVKNQAGTLVAEYSYNGLGYRTGWHYDVDGDLSVEANTAGNTDDPWYEFVYDSRWRLVATYRASHYSTWSIDANPREQFVYNMSGVAGSGGSSYIDSMILRDRDANTAWASAADSTLEERVYYCQNWRADVISLFTDAGQLINQVRYDPYGVPFSISKADLNADGAVNTSDITRFGSIWAGGTGTHPLADWNFDGSVNTSDYTAFLNSYNADTALGRGNLSYIHTHLGGDNRKAYAGYELDPVLADADAATGKNWQGFYHVRNRVYLSQLGRWTRRDPLGYVDGMNTYNYALSPNVISDSTGMRCVLSCIGCVGALLAAGGGGLGIWAACTGLSAGTMSAACAAALVAAAGGGISSIPICASCISCLNPPPAPTPLPVAPKFIWPRDWPDDPSWPGTKDPWPNSDSCSCCSRLKKNLPDSNGPLPTNPGPDPCNCYKQLNDNEDRCTECANEKGGFAIGSDDTAKCRAEAWDQYQDCWKACPLRFHDPPGMPLPLPPGSPLRPTAPAGNVGAKIV